ncbi:hypothetical protein OJ998_19330 [Solirubrobacter taibaiensis]|nr:hypothetical protein [Solirubrobacter taibaiensis]
MWKSLLLWVLRRVPGRGPGVLEFGYAKEQAPLIGVFIFVSALELVVLHLLLPWETIRLIVDILSLWGLLWMIGLLAGVLIHPHLVGPDGLRVRDRWVVDLLVPWSNIEAVRARRGGRDDEDGVLSVPILNRTKVEVVLREPVDGARVVRLFVDDAAGFVTAARGRLSQGAPETDGSLEAAAGDAAVAGVRRLG